MSTVTERFDVDPERAWVGGVLAAVAALVGGSIAFPGAVYDRFLWKYFWGPVYADAHGARCAWRADGANRLGRTANACGAAPDSTLAFPGYTLVSEVGYAVTLVVALVGLAFLLRRLAIDRYRALFFSLFPFVIFGGALRVVEDVNDAAFVDSGGSARLIAYPLNTLAISPLIYVTVFAVALAALVAGVALERRGRVEGFEYPVAAVGGTASVVTVGFLAAMAVASAFVTFFPLVLVATLVGAVLVTALAWEGIERFAPHLNDGTGRMGLVVLFGQSVDGVANVVGLDWVTALGGPTNLVPKHPVNRFVVETTDAVLPAAITSVTGTAWPFLLVKVVAAVFIIWIFDERVIEESPRYSVMLLLAAVAVGLGPGTRDMLRATFGV